MSLYNNLINKPEHAEMSVDIACRKALSQRDISHLTIPIDIQEERLKGEYSMHKVPGHTSDFYSQITISDKGLIEKAAEILIKSENIGHIFVMIK